MDMSALGLGLAGNCSMLSRIGQLLEQPPGVGLAPIVGVELEEKVSELPLEVVEESRVVSGSLEAHGFQAKGHGDSIEVRLGVDYEAQARGHALPQIFRQLGRSKVEGHGSHTLRNPPHYALPEISATQRVSIIMIIIIIIILILIIIIISRSRGRDSASNRGGGVDGAVVVVVWIIEFSTASSSSSSCICI